MERAYAVISVKSFDPKKRTFSGWATTPAVDRVGDIISPLGVKYAPDLPLLLHHDARLPVGRARFNKPTKAGIKFDADIPKIDEPGVLQDRTQEAWQSVESGVIRAVSIGFRALEDGVERLPSGGLHYKSIEVMELSLCAIPANHEATIENVKRFEFGGSKDMAVITNEPVLDLRAAALAKVDGELTRLQRQIADKQAQVKADTSKHALDQDEGMQRRLNAQISTLSQTVEKLHEKRFAVEIGEAEKPKPAIAHQSAREVGASKEYLAAEVAAMKALGMSHEARNVPFTLGEHAIFFVEITQAFNRVRERIEAIEATGRQDAYKGVYQRALPYGKGAMVTHDGSLWAALQDVQEGTLPGTNPTSWQLAAKGTTNPPKLGKAHTRVGGISHETQGRACAVEDRQHRGVQALRSGPEGARLRVSEEKAATTRRPVPGDLLS
ncbi:HK97 family phage prohead protease [Mesorhizobium newzealandense]|uniref:HK97 family phage prohead protease n=1 Tax=Mesorhizobium newzealandense TaxID=1300302 RepID=A0ABW4UKC0_9HYPH